MRKNFGIIIKGFTVGILLVTAYFIGVLHERDNWVDRENMPIFNHNWNAKHGHTQVVSLDKLNKQWFHFERIGETDEIKILGPAAPSVVKRLSARIALREYYTNGGRNDEIIEALYKEIDVE
jgi:hypothetical protein